MKTIATFHNVQGQVTGIVSGPDYSGQSVMVNGKVWHFDFDRFLGPYWMRKDGEPRKCQNPNKKVWAAFEVWLKTIPATSRYADG